jgi:hypothetical protein
MDDETDRAVDAYLTEIEENDFLDKQSNAEYYDE